MVLKNNSNVSEGNQPKKSFELIEEGYQTVRLLTIGDEVKSKNGKGSYIEATFEIASGKHEKRRLWHKFFMTHTNPMVKKIGRDQLDKLLIASGNSDGLSGISNNDDLQDLVGEIVKVKVGINESEGFPPQNKITAFYPLKGRQVAA